MYEHPDQVCEGECGEHKEVQPKLVYYTIIRKADFYSGTIIEPSNMGGTIDSMDPIMVESLILDALTERFNLEAPKGHTFSPGTFTSSGAKHITRKIVYKSRLFVLCKLPAPNPISGWKP